MNFIQKLLHAVFPAMCARDAPIIWQHNEIRCPVCGRMLAYRYLVDRNTRYEVHVCYPFAYTREDLLLSANASIADEYNPDPYGVDTAILMLQQRPLEEPLDSDEWEGGNTEVDDITTDQNKNGKTKGSKNE